MFTKSLLPTGLNSTKNPPPIINIFGVQLLTGPFVIVLFAQTSQSQGQKLYR
jgi:hypothetical protein